MKARHLSLDLLTEGLVKAGVASRSDEDHEMGRPAYFNNKVSDEEHIGGSQMCEQTRRRDANHVIMEGNCNGGLKFYEAKGQARTEFWLRSDYGGVVTKIQLQFRRNKAHEALMLYQDGRLLGIQGRLKYRGARRDENGEVVKPGTYIVVVNEFQFGSLVKPMTAEDLLAKIKVMGGDRYGDLGSQDMSSPEQVAADEGQVDIDLTGVDEQDLFADIQEQERKDADVPEGLRDTVPGSDPVYGDEPTDDDLEAADAAPSVETAEGGIGLADEYDDDRR